MIETHRGQALQFHALHQSGEINNKIIPACLAGNTGAGLLCFLFVVEQLTRLINAVFLRIHVCRRKYGIAGCDK